MIPFFAWGIAYAQNFLEDEGVIPAVLKAPVGGVVRPLPSDPLDFERAYRRRRLAGPEHRSGA